MASRSLPSSSPVASLVTTQREKSDYRAAQRSTKLRPRPRGIPAMGASADYHLRSESDHLWIGELGQEYARNDPVGRRLLSCVEHNVLQDVGFECVPDTGDKSVDEDLKAWWSELSNDPTRIDLQGEHTLDELARYVLKAVYASGDIFAVFNQDGPIELREFHRCRQPSRSGKTHERNVLGVEMNEKRQRVRYWFTKEPIDPLRSATVKHADLTPVDAYDNSDEWRLPNVLHLYDPQRATQTRGVSLFAPVFDYLGMHDDCQFQQLVRQQISNMFLVVRERGLAFDERFLGSRMQAGIDSGDVVDRVLENLYPGAELPGFPGEQIKPWAPSIPNTEWFDHMRLVLRLIGLGWGLPYVLLMLDTSDTTFHGYRGAVNEAHTLFRVIQNWLASGFHSPVRTHYLHREADEDPVFRRMRERSSNPRSKFNLFRCSWVKPGWDSVDPLKDASANLLMLANSLTSHTRLARNHDTDWPTLSKEIVADNLAHRINGVEAAREYGKSLGVSEPTPEQLERWCEKLAPMPTAERTQLSLSLQETPQTSGASDE